jgi:hypothetical protein
MRRHQPASADRNEPRDGRHEEQQLAPDRHRREVAVRAEDLAGEDGVGPADEEHESIFEDEWQGNAAEAGRVGLALVDERPRIGHEEAHADPQRLARRVANLNRVGEVVVHASSVRSAGNTDVISQGW